MPDSDIYLTRFIPTGKTVNRYRYSYRYSRFDGSPVCVSTCVYVSVISVYVPSECVCGQSVCICVLPKHVCVCGQCVCPKRVCLWLKCVYVYVA